MWFGTNLDTLVLNSQNFTTANAIFQCYKKQETIKLTRGQTIKIIRKIQQVVKSPINTGESDDPATLQQDVPSESGRAFTFAKK